MTPTQPRKPLHPGLMRASDDEPLFDTKGDFLTARSELTSVLAAKYPGHFGPSCRPWAFGIREALMEELLSPRCPEELIRHTLHRYAQSVPYLTSCVLAGVGAKRYRLDGQPEGELTRSQLIYALNKLSGLVRRKDEEQSLAYREWALREMILGLLKGDVTAEDLERSRVQKKRIKKALELAADPKTPEKLKLCHMRTKELHPSVYAAPYLNSSLFKRFKELHPDHVTSRKPKTRRSLILTPQEPAATPPAKQPQVAIAKKAPDGPVKVLRRRRRNFTAPAA